MTDRPELTDQEILERLAGWIVERRMTAPAILFLESHRPLSFVGSQAMIAAAPIVHYFEPFLRALLGAEFDNRAYDRFAGMMEDRDNLELFIIEIERKSQDAKEKAKEEKRRKKALKREAKEQRKALRRAARKGRGQD